MASPRRTAEKEIAKYGLLAFISPRPSSFLFAKLKRPPSSDPGSPAIKELKEITINWGFLRIFNVDIPTSNVRFLLEEKKRES